MRRWTRPALGLSLLMAILALALGCRQEVPALFRRNQLPETTLTIIPQDSTVGFYSYHVYWRGEDRDGRVVRYIFAITDTLSRNEEENWDPNLAEDRQRSFYTEKTDSIFIFNSARGRQAFNISAIDDFGKADRTPARAFFKIVDRGQPKVRFLDVRLQRPGRPDTVQCTDALACTIPNFTNFKVRFTGTTFNHSITGFQWQGLRPSETNPEPVQPFGADSLFLRAGTDTVAFSAEGDSLWRLDGDVVTVYYRSKRPTGGDPPSVEIPSGNFTFRARVRDEANLPSLNKDGSRRVVINYDPDTELYRIPYCDCPNAPRPCTRTDRVHVGFVAGIDQTSWRDSLSKWIPFCEGDTIATASHVRFYARGHDDRRDEAISPAQGLRDVGFSYKFNGRSTGFTQLSMPFSTEYAPIDTLLPPAVGGGVWHGGRKGWGDQGVRGLCPFDFTFFAASVDEHGKRDGTPDSIGFYVSGSPVIDSLRVDSLLTAPTDTLVMVFVPTCPIVFNFACPDVNTLPVFGADTILVTAHNVQANPVDVGRDDFVFPFQGWGHDSPRDRGSAGSPFAAYYHPDTEGRIRAWFFSFNCLPGPSGICDDLQIPGESDWRPDLQPNPDPPGQQTFDDRLIVSLKLDTLCSTRPCGRNFRASLPSDKFGVYRYTLQGRDTDPIGQLCPEPSSLDPNPSIFQRPLSEAGRTTQVEQRIIRWVQYRDVRRPSPQAPKKSLGVALRKRVVR